MNRTVNGNITVYMGMVTGIVLTLIFSLIEVVHFKSLGQEQDILSQLGVESVMADFNRPLWKDYKILAVDGGYGRGEFAKSALENRAMDYLEDNGSNTFLALQPTGTNLTRYALLSDDGGTAFLKEAALEAYYGIPASLLNDTEQLCQHVESSSSGNQSMEDVMQQAQNSLDKADAIRIEQEQAASKEKSKSKNQETTEATVSTDPPKNPMVTVKEWKAKGILAQVIPSDRVLSGACLSNERPSARTLRQGTKSVDSLTAMERMLLGLYFREHFQNFNHSMNHEGLTYEWEYLISGKSSDEENLKATVEKLLALRELQNYVAIHGISECKATAEATAMALVGFTGNPAIIQAVQEGVLASWAYGESVLDVRALLAGKKVALVKTKAEWTSNLDNLDACFDVHQQAKESATGVNYEAYLIGLTYLESPKTLGIRSMDILEAAICRTQGYENCRIDNMVVAGDFEFSYEGNPIFANALLGLRGRLGRYSFLGEKEMSFCKKKTEV
ncbi:MAG: DUF5702 domain-containing protein [Lachnospiraceae bacterium]|nr:DUF5702 domain-containing protein [Lachnospiraceae bacterium]